MLMSNFQHFGAHTGGLGESSFHLLRFLQASYHPSRLRDLSMLVS